MGTKNNPGRFDCYANAAPDEPMFVLLARDPLAPTLLRAWALLRVRMGEDEEKIAEALTCADAMVQWRNANRPPLPQDGELEIVLQDIMLDVSGGLSECPEGYDGPCDCNLCRSYAHE